MQLRELLGRVAASRLGKDVLLTFSAQLFMMLSVFAVTKLVSRGQTVEGFSDYSLIRKNAALFTSLFALGLTEALTHFYAYQQGRRSTAMVQGVLFGESIRLLLCSMLFFLVLFVVFRIPLSFAIFDSDAAWRELGLIYLFAVSLCVFQLLLSYYLGLGDFKKAAWVQVGVNGVFLAGAYFFSGNVALLFILWSLLTLVPLMMIMLAELRSYPRCAGKEMRRLRKLLRKRLLFYGTTRMGSNLVIYGMDVLPLVMILHKLGPRSVSLFSVSISVLQMVVSLFSFTSSIFLQRVSLLRAAGDYSAIDKLLRWAVVPFVSIALAGGVFLYFFSDFVIWLLYTNDFLEASPLIAITSFALLPKAFFFLLKSPIDAFSDKPYMLGVLSVSLLLYAVLLWRSTSLEGSAWAYVWANVAMMVMAILTWRILLAKKLRGQRSGDAL